ncbi:hypothetical protein G7054_g6442 [Neopestalotiopsis clavispora]|nr:hypothetical protein G7054_g6442 [Neopestalotiopsis clavispora]
MKPSSIVTALVAAASMTATSAAPHNSTGVLSPRSDSPETINQVQAKLDQTPGSVWAVNCINDCNKRIACLGECLGKFDSEGQNKPDQAAKDKAVKGLPAVLTLIDCASTAGNIFKVIPCLVKPAPDSMDKIPDWPKKVDAAAETLKCGGSCKGDAKCFLKCILHT